MDEVWAGVIAVLPARGDIAAALRSIWVSVDKALPTLGNIATVLIALFALMAARSQAQSAKHQADLTMMHNKLSVKPVLQLRVKWTINRTESGEPNGVDVDYSIVNSGLGPGTLSDLSVKARDGSTVVLNEGEQHKVERLLELMFPGGQASYVLSHSYWPEGRVIRSGEEVAIASIFFHKVRCPEVNWKTATRENVLATTRALGTDYYLSYTWKSMYDESWTDDKEY